MAHSIARPLTQTRLPRNPVARLVDWLFKLDHDHRQRTRLGAMPDHRLQDMGLQRRDVAKAWTPPPMFLN